MLKIVTKHFNKISQNQSTVLAQECKDLVDILNKNFIKVNPIKNIQGGNINAKGLTHNNTWHCFIEEAEQSNNNDALIALKNVFQEAIEYVKDPKNATKAKEKNVNIELLTSGKALLEQMRQIAF